ncbi:MAG: DedA family protein [Puniceicoccales bacterium]|jgi:membrane protein YqaA with SNARE-associated domain|nr:DedA family protein [Puniceicoccales bacterium]
MSEPILNANEPSAAPSAVPPSTPPKVGVFQTLRRLPRRLYDWVLSWAETKYGLPALCALSFAESSFFPIPPDVLLIALCMGASKKAFKFVAYCALFSVLGGIFGYYIGYAFYDQVGKGIIEFFHYEKQWAKVGDLYGKNAFLAIFTAGFTPIPYKVFTIAAGFFHDKVGLGTLIFASLLGRTGRFALVGGAIYFFGPRIKPYLDKYFELVCVLFMVLLIGSFVLLKYLL